MSDLSVKGKFLGAQKPRHFGKDNEMWTTLFYAELDYDSKYPTIGEFEVWKDKIDLSKFAKDDEMEIHFNIKGRKFEWVDKTTKKNRSGFDQKLQAWKVETVESSAPTPQNEIQENFDEDGEDDLPF